MRFFTFRNFKDKDAVEGEPWEFRGECPAKTKEARRTWLRKDDAEWCVYSMVEDDTGVLRATAESAWQVHGLVVDFDKCKPDDAFVAQVLENAETPPTWWHRTGSGGVRFIYGFPSPVRYFSQTFYKSFVRALNKELGFAIAFPAEVDWQAMEDVKSIWDVGVPGSWVRSGEALPERLVRHAILQAANAENLGREKLPELPFDFIKKRMEEKSASGEWQAWRGQYRDGAHGVRFWDASADNHNAAVIYSTGVLCFTGEEAFLPWCHPKLLGEEARQFSADRVLSAVDGIYYDGRNFWRKFNDAWWDESREDVKLKLCSVGLDPAKGKGETMSELNRALHLIVERNRINDARRIFYRPDGIGRQRDTVFLNISRIRALEAAAEVSEWGVDGAFPWLSLYLDSLFADDRSKQFYLAWLRHFYEGALNMEPRNGHLLILGGDPGGGKTFNSTVFLPHIAGGGTADISKFVSPNNRFDDWVFDKPIWTLDDPPSPDDYAVRRSMERVLKRVVANDEFEVEGKFKKSVRVPFHGRCVLTANTDSDSISSIPTIGDSTTDKFLLLRCRKVDREIFKSKRENVATIRRETPQFLRWLLDVWQPPAYVRPDVRFGFRAYQDPVLMEEIGAFDPATKLVELFEYYFTEEEGVDEIEGSCSKILNTLDNLTEGNLALRSWSPEKIGRALSKLKSRGFKGERKIVRGVGIWTIRRGDIFGDGSEAGVIDDSGAGLDMDFDEPPF